jgi:hypothetical protein
MVDANLNAIIRQVPATDGGLHVTDCPRIRPAGRAGSARPLPRPVADPRRGPAVIAPRQLATASGYLRKVVEGAREPVRQVRLIQGLENQPTPAAHAKRRGCAERSAV